MIIYNIDYFGSNLLVTTLVLFKVTYDGWSDVYDEYVEPKQCIRCKDDQQVDDTTTV